jgi:hypothetical protein
MHTLDNNVLLGYIYNEMGQEKAIERVAELTEIPKYRRTAQPEGDPRG